MVVMIERGPTNVTGTLNVHKYRKSKGRFTRFYISVRVGNGGSLGRHREERKSYFGRRPNLGWEVLDQDCRKRE